MPERLLEETAEELFEDAPCGYVITTPDGRLLRVNRTFESWTGRSREQLLDGRRFQDLLTRAGRVYHETHVAPLLRMQDAVAEIALELEAADGRRMPVLVNSTLKRDDDGRPALVRTMVFNATERRRYERELLRTRRDEQAAREAMEGLQRITSAVVAAVDPEGIARAFLDELARTLRPVAAAFFVARHDGLRRVAETGDGAPSADALESTAGDGDGAVIVRGTAGDGGLEVVLRLRCRERQAGLVWARLATGAELDDPHRTLLAAGAAQCALALDRAGLYEHEHAVADQLQRSLLEGPRFEDPRSEIAAHYQAGVTRLQVGGDWHDAFQVAEATVGLVVGDVVGRGLQAASAMGQLRSAVRALAVAGMGVSGVLEQLDRFVEDAEPMRMATLAYAEVRLGADAATVGYACAGHPPPLLLRRAGAPRLLWDGRSAPLGARLVPGPRDQAEVVLAPGDRLLLYTDGVVERRGETIDDGLDRLLATAAPIAPDAGPAAVIDVIAGALLQGAPEDDACLLCLRLAPGASAAAP